MRKHALVLALLAGCAPAKTGDPAAAPDAGPAFPPPRVAGTPVTDAVADAPARCGQPAHRWLRDATLGDMVSRGDVTEYTADFLAGLIATANLPVPRPPYYDARVATLTYSTQDRGTRIDATGLVAWPYGLASGAAPIPVLLVLHGTQGFKDGCSLDSSAETKLLAAYFSSLGYFVVAPDYLGLKAHAPPTGFPHPYLVGQATAIASLDMVRAAAKLPPAQQDGVEVANRVAMFGGSQGGHAVLWVDRLAPYYAPELNLVGGVATVPPADLLAEAQRALTQVVPATGNTLALFGASSSWYGLAARLHEVLKTPYDTSVPAALAADCNPAAGLPSGGVLSDVFQPLLLDAAAAGTLSSVDPWGCVVAENGLTTTSIARVNADAPSYGILAVWGGSDTLVDTATEKAAFPSLCGAGSPLKYLECAGASHTRATAWSLPETVKFIEDRLAGVPFTRDCATPDAVRCEGTPP